MTHLDDNPAAASPFAAILKAVENASGAMADIGDEYEDSDYIEDEIEDSYRLLGETYAALSRAVRREPSHGAQVAIADVRAILNGEPLPLLYLCDDGDKIATANQMRYVDPNADESHPTHGSLYGHYEYMDAGWYSDEARCEGGEELTAFEQRTGETVRKYLTEEPRGADGVAGVCFNHPG